MGTRHNIQVTVNDKIKISQYGQWDGYPTGQGAGIADFLRTAELDLFRKKVWKLGLITKKEIEEINATENWQKEYPWLSRDAGSEILRYVYEDKAKFVVRNEDMSWCEYLYNIDLDKKTVTVGTMTFPFEVWTEECFMEQLEEDERDEEDDY